MGPVKYNLSDQIADCLFDVLADSPSEEEMKRLEESIEEFKQQREYVYKRLPTIARKFFDAIECAIEYRKEMER